MVKFKENRILGYDQENDIVLVNWTKEMTSEDFDIYENGIVENKEYNESIDRLRVLVNLSQFRSMPSSEQRRRAINIIVNIVPKIEDEKTAIIGLSPIASIAVNAILLVTGSRIKVYATKEDAIAWLKV